MELSYQATQKLINFKREMFVRKVPNYKNSVKSEKQAAARLAYTEKKEKQWAECEVRQEDAGKVSPEKRLQILDARLGKGQGAKRERARLLKKIEEAKFSPKKASKAPKENKADT
jgi:hypothetical protein